MYLLSEGSAISTWNVAVNNLGNTKDTFSITWDNSGVPRDAGYDTLEAVGTQAPGTLSDATGIGKESCAKFVTEARSHS